MNIALDRKIYSDATISKTVYALSKDFCCKRDLDGDIENVEIVPINNTISEEKMSQLFWQTLNDYKTREIISAETKDIRTILYAKAFADCDDFDLNVE